MYACFINFFISKYVEFLKSNPYVSLLKAAFQEVHHPVKQTDFT